MAIHDACPVREKPQVHQAVRSLLKKMKINIMETKFHGTRSKCCDDDLYPAIPVEKVQEKMCERAVEMPCEAVCVYCVSCIKAMHLGSNEPRLLMDLLMEQTTELQTYDIVAWHKQLQGYIDQH